MDAITIRWDTMEKNVNIDESNNVVGGGKLKPVLYQVQK